MFVLFAILPDHVFGYFLTVLDSVYDDRAFFDNGNGVLLRHFTILYDEYVEFPACGETSTFSIFHGK